MSAWWSRWRSLAAAGPGGGRLVVAVAQPRLAVLAPAVSSRPGALG